MPAPPIAHAPAAALLALLALAACAPTRAAETSTPRTAERGQEANRRAIVVPGGDAAGGRSDNALQAMQGRVSGLEVRRTTGCPELVMRGRKSIHQSNNPVVYFDGTRVSDTCILETTLMLHLDRIEVYPMGITARPGYRNHPNGLILLFSQNGAD